ncbi:MAG TPA: SPOR domain-containing protein [Bacteroidales bacterium]|nr:SPOR domain-containing protein [Bacteroidales bacterium]
MIRKLFLLSVILCFYTVFSSAQAFVSTASLFKRPLVTNNSGSLNIIQNRALDSLISRYIMVNNELRIENDHYGMPGYRIQIFNSSTRNARDESNKTMAEFLSKFPDIKAYALYAQPGWFKIRVGDFRTKAEAIKLFLAISKDYPDSYLVPDFINFPDLVKK